MKNHKTVLIFTGLVFLFVAPMLLAWAFYTHHQWLPNRKTNHGQLLSPPLDISQLQLPTNPRGKWRLFLIQTQPCDEGCQKNLFIQGQIQKALGKDMNRLQRVIVTFGENDNKSAPVQTGQGAIQLLGNLEVFKNRLGEVQTWYIADPLGNIMLSYSASANPDDILSDLQHLLEVSKIG